MTEKCKDVMTGEPECCVPGDTVQHVAKLMKEKDVGPIPVCDSHDSKKIVGIVTDRDIAMKVVAEGRDPKNTRVGDIMTSQVFTCRADDDIENALKEMERHQVRRIPVVSREGRIVGIIAQADIATRLKSPEKTAEVVAEISKPKTALAGGA